NSTDNPYGHRAARVGSIKANRRIARTAAARRTQCRVDTRPGQCGASSLQGGNHAFPHSETVRDLPVRRAQGAGVRISKGWKRQVISRPQETRLQNKRVGARLIKPRTTPGGAGDGAGNGGQARIRRALAGEAIGDDGDGVALALIVANEHCAGLEAAPWRAALPRQPVQEPQAFPIKPAKGPLLQAISDHSPQEVLAQICWRGSARRQAPEAPK